MSDTRCSSLPRLFRCGQSANIGDIIDAEPAIEHDVQAGRVGAATHEVLREYYSGDFQAEHVQNICAGLGVDQGEVWPLVNVAKKIVMELGLGKVPDAMEDEISEGGLSGHPDAEWTHAGEYWIGDWKTSRLDPGYFHQLMGYAWLRRQRIRDLGRGCNLFVAWLRDSQVERYWVTADSIDAWYQQFLAIVPTESPYVTGEQCTHCPRVTDCPAQREDLRQALTVLDGGTVDVATLDGETIARVTRKLRLLVSVKEKWEDALKNRIRATGPVDCGDGYALTLATENGKLEVDTAAAWPILQRELTADEMASCVSIRIGAAKDIVAKKAPPRKGAAAVLAFAAELKAAGAIKQGTIEKLKEVRTQNLSEKKEIAE